MFCAKCGQAATEPYCRFCGAPTGFTAAATAPAVSRVAAHLRTLGVLWIVYAIYQVLRWLLVLPVLHLVLGSGASWIDQQDTWIYGFHPGGWLLHLITVVVFVRALLSLAAGFGLLRAQPWGRVLAIVVAILTLIKPLLGTLLAIYTLWVLLSRNAGPEYDRIAGAEPPL